MYCVKQREQQYGKSPKREPTGACRFRGGHTHGWHDWIAQWEYG